MIGPYRKPIKQNGSRREPYGQPGLIRTRACRQDRSVANNHIIASTASFPRKGPFAGMTGGGIGVQHRRCFDTPFREDASNGRVIGQTGCRTIGQGLPGRSPVALNSGRLYGSAGTTWNGTVASVPPSALTTFTSQLPVHPGRIFLLLQVRQAELFTGSGTIAISLPS